MKSDFVYSRFPLWIVVVMWLAGRYELKKTKDSSVNSVSNEYVVALNEAIEIIRKGFLRERILPQQALKALITERNDCLKM